MGLTTRRPALRKNRRLPRAQERFALTIHEPAQLLRGVKTAQRLQSRDRLRSRRMASDAGRESDFSVLRNSELGRTSCGVAAGYRISGGDDSCLGIRAYAGRNQARGRSGRNATTFPDWERRVTGEINCCAAV